jgi:hypothetical protein
MANYRTAARRAARRYGLDPNVFSRQIQQESGFNPSARSSAGAIGIAQIMPATARGWGVNPSDPIAALDAAAKNMARYVKQYGSYKNALGPRITPYSAEQQAARPQSTPLQAPSFSAQAPVPEGYQAVQAGSSPEKPSQDSQIAEAISKLSQLSNTIPTATTGGNKIAGAGASPAALKGAKGATKFEGRPVAGWIAPILRYARAQGWKGQINSGYRSTAEQRRIYNSGVRPAAKPGTSNHEFTAYPGGAIDVSDAQSLSNILRRSKYRKLLVYAGAKDPVHFSHPHGGSY